MGDHADSEFLPVKDAHDKNRNFRPYSYAAN